MRCTAGYGDPQSRHSVGQWCDLVSDTVESNGDNDGDSRDNAGDDVADWEESRRSECFTS